MNSRELKQYQAQQAHEQEQLVGYWIKRMGISKKDLDSHPQIDDVMLLIKFRTEFWDMNTHFKKTFERTWNWVYKNKMPLKRKHLNNLNRIGKTIVKWRQNRQDQVKIIQAHRNRIKGI